MGIFLVIEIRSGIVVSWDRKTSVFVRLQQHYKASVATPGTLLLGSALTGLKLEADKATEG